MKLLYTFSLILASLSASAQTVRLWLDQPAPRAGDNIEVKYTIRPGNGSSIASGSIIIATDVSDTADIKVGPCMLQLDGKKYITDSITIKLDDPLPEITEGVWIRKVKENDHEYIIIEQRMLFDIKSNFMRINQAELEEAGISLKNNSSHSSMSSITIGDKKGSMCYKRTVYMIEKKPEFKGPFRLRKKHFFDCPEGAELDTILIE